MAERRTRGGRDAGRHRRVRGGRGDGGGRRLPAHEPGAGDDVVLALLGRQRVRPDAAAAAVGVGILFFNGRSVAGWLLTIVGCAIILAGILMNMDIYFRQTSLFNTLVMLVLLAGGIGLVARSLRSGGAPLPGHRKERELTGQAEITLGVIIRGDGGPGALRVARRAGILRACLSIAPPNSPSPSNARASTPC